MWMGTHPWNGAGIMIGVVFWLMVPLFFGCWYLDWKGYMERLPTPARSKHLFKNKPKNKMTLSEVIVECQKAENKKRYLKRRFQERSKVEAVEAPAVKATASEELIE